MSSRTAVFLDRDGVLCEALVRNGRAYAPTSLEEFRVVPEASVQVERLRRAGLACLVFTNQPEIARGLLAPTVLDAMHAQLRDEVPVDAIYVCPHAPDEGCECHKPRPGLLLTAAGEWSVNLSGSFVIGDRWRDIEAGHSVGCFTVLLARPYSQCSSAHTTVADLAAAVDVVLERFDGRSAWNS